MDTGEGRPYRFGLTGELDYDQPPHPSSVTLRASIAGLLPLWLFSWFCRRPDRLLELGQPSRSQQGGLLDLNARKDHFSRAIVRAIAATAGVAASVPEHDQDSIDMTFVEADSSSPGAKLDAQLKCSQNIEHDGEAFSYALPVKNYNDLRWPSTELFVPRILIVVHVPVDPADWLVSEPEKMTLKRCAYWVSLAGAEATENTSTVSVRIPSEQVFDPTALRARLSPPGAALS